MEARALTAAFILAAIGISVASSSFAATTYRPISLLFGETACVRSGGTVVVQNSTKVCAVADVPTVQPSPPRNPSQPERMKLPYEDDPKAGQ